MAFELEVSRWVEKVQGNMDEAFRRLAFQLARKIVERTPVKTGAARGGWQAGVNAIPSGDTAADPGGEATLARIAAVIATAKVGDVIYISNGQPHILRLEHGWSEQSPAGMVKVTLVEAQSIANRVAAGLRG
jgi:hypothetical protein